MREERKYRLLCAQTQLLFVTVSYCACHKIQTSGTYRGRGRILFMNVSTTLPNSADSVSLKINGEPDHIHILMEVDAITSPAELANVLKTQTARRARKLYGETLLKKYY